MSGHVIFEDAGTGLADQADRDWADAAHLMAMAHADNDTDYVVSGLSLTPDWAVPEVAVTSGMVRVSAADVSTRDHGTATVTWPAVTVTALVDPATVALTAGTVNELWLDIQLTSGQPNDVGLVAVDSGASPPSQPALKIAEIDTSAETVTRVGDRPDVAAHRLSATAEFSPPVVPTEADLPDATAVPEGAEITVLSDANNEVSVYKVVDQ